MAYSPGDRRREHNGDENPCGEECLIAEERESKRATTRCHELHLPVVRLHLPHELHILKRGVQIIITKTMV
jgi:hypothetical protein